MKLTNKKTLTFLFIIILLSFSFNKCLISKRFKSTKNDKEISGKNIDNKFLNSVNNLKNFMITKQGTQLKKLGLKFITKDNRYVIAQENIAVNSIENIIKFLSNS